MSFDGVLVPVLVVLSSSRSFLSTHLFKASFLASRIFPSASILSSSAAFLQFSSFYFSSFDLSSSLIVGFEQRSGSYGFNGGEGGSGRGDASCF